MICENKIIIQSEKGVPLPCTIILLTSITNNSRQIASNAVFSSKGWAIIILVNLAITLFFFIRLGGYIYQVIF
jgi:hypothetical protein